MIFPQQTEKDRTLFLDLFVTCMKFTGTLKYLIHVPSNFRKEMNVPLAMGLRKKKFVIQ